MQYFRLMVLLLIVGRAPGAAPVITSGKVVDGATLDPSRGIAGGAWITIFGTNLAPRTRSWSAADFVNGRAPASLEGVSVRINDKPAYIAFLMRGGDFGLGYDQINALAPVDETTGPVPVQVVTPEGASAAVTVNKVALAPAFFPFEPEGRKYLAAGTPDGIEYIGKYGLFGSNRLDRPIRPARTSEIVTLYGSGFGPLNPPLADGAVARGTGALARPVVVRFGGAQAEVLYAGPAPDLTGVYQFNVRVPDVAPGELEVTAEVDGVRTPGGRLLVIGDAEYPKFEHTQLSSFRLTGRHVFTDCGACHLRGRFLGTPTACAACHFAAYEQTTSPNHAAVNFPTECGSCHHTSQFRGAGSHQNTRFQLSGAHGRLQCSQCHANGRLERLDTNCASCHLARYEKTTSPNHAAAGLPKDCAVCHSTGSFRGATLDHSRTGFALSGAHVNLQCASCHREGQYKGLQADCAGCHIGRYNATAAPNHAAAGFPEKCAICHTTTSFRGAAFSHARFELTGAHQRAQCSSCHSEGRYLGTPTQCASCHMARYTATTAPNHAAAGFPANCALCHSTTQFRGARFVHARFTLTGAHIALDCSRCHSSQRYAGTSTECASCHMARYAATTAPDHAAAGFPTNCSACHTTSSFKGATFSHTRFALTGAHQRAQCSSCHASGQFAGASTECASCHMTRYTATTAPNHAAAGFPTNCPACHSTSSFRGATFSHIRFALTGAHQRAQCSSCHASGQFAGTPTQCASCHMARYTATTAPNHAASGFPADCSLCHNTAQFGGAVFSHKFPIYSGEHARKWTSCATCHVNAANFREFSCLGCHDKVRTDGKHAGRNGYSYNSAACYGCHPAGKE